MSGRAVGTDVQAAAAVVDTIGTGASGNGTLESVLVSPALDVVAVEAVTGTVTTSPGKTVEILDGSSVIEKLIEDRENGLGVRLRANTEVVVTNCGESNLSWRVSQTSSLGRFISFYLRGSCGRWYPSSYRPSRMGRKSQHEVWCKACW